MSFGIVPYLLLKIKSTQDLLHYFIEMLRVFRSAGSVAANNGSNDNFRPDSFKLSRAKWVKISAGSFKTSTSV